MSRVFTESCLYNGVMVCTPLDYLSNYVYKEHLEPICCRSTNDIKACKRWELHQSCKIRREVKRQRIIRRW